MPGAWLLILVIFGATAGLELPGIIKKKQWKELAVYSVFFTLGLVIIVLNQVFKIKFTGITDWFISVFGMWK